MIRPKYDAPPKPTAREEHEAYELVQLRDMGRCVRCGRADPVFGMSMDHRKNRSQGGLTLASNLQTLCGSGVTECHGWKTSHPEKSTSTGFAVPGHADPLDFPAMRLIVVRTQPVLWPVLYDNAGGFTEISRREFSERLEAAGILPELKGGD